MATPLTDDAAKGRVLGRYVLYDAIASGGMGSVHLGRLVGQAGFSRTVAIKKLHAHLAGEPEFVEMFLDEARLAARVQHPNVISTLDVVVVEGEIFLVMEYVHGDSLARLMKSNTPGILWPIPPPLSCSILAGVLHGLHAAHEARGERGDTLDIVHRDVSPQNVMVGVDGAARVFDFGVAKAAIRLQSTAEGKIKGKIAYMAPEQLRGRHVTRRADVYSASVVLWEMLTGRRLFQADNQGHLVEQVLTGLIPPPSHIVEGLPLALDDLLAQGLDRHPGRRFSTAEEMAIALERVITPATASQVGAWVRDRAKSRLEGQMQRIARIEEEMSQEDLPGFSAVMTPPASQESLLDPRVSERPVSTPVRAGWARWHTAAAVAVAVTALAIVLAVGLAHPSPLPSRIAAPTPIESSSGSGEPPSGAEIVGAVPPVSTPAALSASSNANVAKPAARSLPPATRPAARAPRRGCDPPYTRDPSGRIQWKLECL